MVQSTLLELNEPDKKLKFSDWYFDETLDVSTRIDLVVPREKYFKELKSKIRVGRNTVVFAYPGQGKTLSTKHFFNDWKKDDGGIKIIYVNCKDANSEKKVFNSIIEQMKPIYPPVEDIAKKNERTAIYEFVKNIPKNQRFFLVLDEIDVPVHNDKKAHKGEWLTVFFRAEELDASQGQPDWWKGPQWNVIMITNKLAFEDSLDRNEKQHIQHMGISPYDPNDVYQIFLRRVEDGITKGHISSNLFSEEELFRLAKTTVDQFDSNVRFGFKLLIKCAEIAVAKNQPISKEIINQGIEEFYVDLVMDDIADMPTNSRMFLFSVLVYLKNKQRMSGYTNIEGYKGLFTNFFLKDIYPVYAKFCSENRMDIMKAMKRAGQRYVTEGIDTGMYLPTGKTESKHREYGITFELNKVYDRVTKRYNQFNFDISLV